MNNTPDKIRKFCNGKPLIRESILKTIADEFGKKCFFFYEDFEESYGLRETIQEMIDNNELICPASGIYVPTKKSVFSDDIIMRYSIFDIMREWLIRTGRVPTMSSAEIEYNSGRSTQVPAGGVTGYFGKKTDKKFYSKGRTFIFEHMGDYYT